MIPRDSPGTMRDLSSTDQASVNGTMMITYRKIPITSIYDSYSIGMSYRLVNTPFYLNTEGFIFGSRNHTPCRRRSLMIWVLSHLKTCAGCTGGRKMVLGYMLHHPWWMGKNWILRSGEMPSSSSMISIPQTPLTFLMGMERNYPLPKP